MGCKNINIWFNSLEFKRNDRGYNAPKVYTNTLFDKRFLDYLSPTYFDSIGNNSEKNICNIEICKKTLQTIDCI